MFEAVRRLWLGVALIAATSVFLLYSDTGQRTGTIPHAAVLKFSSMQALDDGERGLFDYLAAHGYDGKHKVIIDKFNAENDVATSNAIAKEMTSAISAGPQQLVAENWSPDSTSWRRVRLSGFCLILAG